MSPPPPNSLLFPSPPKCPFIPNILDFFFNCFIHTCDASVFWLFHHLWRQQWAVLTPGLSVMMCECRAVQENWEPWLRDGIPPAWAHRKKTEWCWQTFSMEGWWHQVAKRNYYCRGQLWIKGEYCFYFYYSWAFYFLTGVILGLIYIAFHTCNHNQFHINLYICALPLPFSAVVFCMPVPWNWMYESCSCEQPSHP